MHMYMYINYKPTRLHDDTTGCSQALLGNMYQVKANITDRKHARARTHSDSEQLQPLG